MLWRHKKTGNIYIQILEAIDATNIRRSNKVIVYARCNMLGEMYVRDKSEFEEKFEKVE